MQKRWSIAAVATQFQDSFPWPLHPSNSLPPPTSIVFSTPYASSKLANCTPHMSPSSWTVSGSSSPSQIPSPTHRKASTAPSFNPAPLGQSFTLATPDAPPFALVLAFALPLPLPLSSSLSYVGCSHSPSPKPCCGSWISMGRPSWISDDDSGSGIGSFVFGSLMPVSRSASKSCVLMVPKVCRGSTWSSTVVFRALSRSVHVSGEGVVIVVFGIDRVSPGCNGSVERRGDGSKPVDASDLRDFGGKDCLPEV